MVQSGRTLASYARDRGFKSLSRYQTKWGSMIDRIKLQLLRVSMLAARKAILATMTKEEIAEYEKLRKKKRR